MADVYFCAHCGSNNLMHQMDAVQCLACGNRTLYDGTACPKEPVFEGSDPRRTERPQ